MSDFLDYISKWFGWRTAGAGAIVELPSVPYELDVIKHYSGAKWEDVTSSPDLADNLKPTTQESNPKLLLGERIFKRGRVYMPRADPVHGLDEARTLAKDISANNLNLESSTGYLRNKNLRYILLSGWTTAAHATKKSYPDLAAAGTPQILVKRRIYNTAQTPGSLLVAEEIIFTINATINPFLLGFNDLLLDVTPPLPIPFYNEIRVEVNGANGAIFMDAFIGVEVN